MRRRCLMISASYPTLREPYRGIFIRHLAECLSQKVDLTLLVPSPGGKGRPLPFEGGRVVSFPYWGERLKSYRRTPVLPSVSFLLSCLQRGLRLVRRADFLLVHWILPTGLIGAWLSRFFGVPLALYAHGSDVLDVAFRGRGMEFLAKWTVQRAGLVFGVNGGMVELLRSRFGASRVVLAPCGVLRKFFLVDRDPEYPPRILFVGDLEERKGVETLLQAAEILFRRGRNFYFDFVGEGRLRYVLEGIVARQGWRERVRFWGALPPAEVAGMLARARVFALPSWSEGCPVAAMEALAAGVPVVGTRIGGFYQIVEEGRNGILVPLRDPEALADGIERALSLFPNSVSSTRVYSVEAWGEFLWQNLVETFRL
ncbi:MAG: glycosyltransferase family 4 protein [Planctomycetota bacterium]|nr:MAG: glycosyltransferase family 4 protein [Planctomycetota bacterium]